ncbi:putative bifunctional diguanylate cyclase/phosphodiesterase [Fundidesulfovibrio terrae]|uniref:putative bifunctional diguanylate cyclase/phosphodiesterase n=1 Tax=Fundidesulfovibrio terrae TaxID=2922866 RepID=UPI001FAF17F1|nr:EAL domain-containing protein [Fundidesulfovibrio terrae]
MSFTVLQRITVALLAVMFLAVAWAVADYSRRTGSMVDTFVSSRISEEDGLRGIEFTLGEAMRLAMDMHASRKAPAETLLVLLERISDNTRDIPEDSQGTVRRLRQELSSARTGLLMILDKRPRPAASGRPAPEATAVRKAVDNARATVEDLARTDAAQPGALTYLSSSLAGVSEALDGFLGERPDPLPVIMKQLDAVRMEVEELSTLPQWQGGEARELLQGFKRAVYLLMGNIPKLQELQESDPNGAAAQMLAHTDKLLWDEAVSDIRRFKSLARAGIRQGGQDIETVLAYDKNTVLAVSMGCMLAAMGVIFILQRLLNRRIGVLRAGAARVAAGELEHRIPPGARDPFGRLGADFNLMAESLEKQRHALGETLSELRAARENLEERVHERTLELHEALESLRLKDSAFTQTLECVLLAGPDGALVDVNPAMLALTGYEREDLLGRTPEIFNSGRNDPELYDQLRQALDENGKWNGEIWFKRKDGEDIPLWMILTRLKGDDGETIGTVAISRDMTEHKRAQDKIAREARLDFLTGLPNRGTFMEALASSMARDGRNGHKLAVMFLDLDDFKHINDTLGHPGGDEILKQAGARLQTCVREKDLVARFGGDEFVIMAASLHDSEQALALSRRILTAFRAPFAAGDGSVRVQTSVGVAVFPGDGQSPEALLKNADLALYRAKSLGKGHVECFTPELGAQARNRLNVERELALAVERRQFEVHYLPIVMVCRPVILGAEALVRWRKSGSLLPPAMFVPLAEEMGLMQEITAQVIETAARDMRSWAERGAPGLHLSLNLSALQFTQPRFEELFALLNAQTESLRGCMELEITESAVMRDPARAAGQLQMLRDQGFAVALDDFGTGRASLHSLEHLPLTSVKIDKKFVSDLNSKATQAVLRATISVAKGLGLIVQAEGVETPDQLNFLRQCGCDFYQGFHFSPPVSSTEFLDMVHRQHQGGAGRQTAFQDSHMLQ